MLRHEPQPGRLLAGLVLITAAVLYTGDAVSAWSIPWWVLFPLVCGGLWLAAAVGVFGHLVRRRRRRKVGERVKEC
ncbi:hypothetical protein ACGF0C_16125 [Streptomyces albidoflavus]|uniref:hypothetical protein n=1 Tax=Streptomyces TaxID=1883 RepID=UPI0004C57AE6|nr:MULTISPECIES: hypothetical protein [Streptomyces]QHC15956.1 hypothetical protein GR131_11155 [Streptomyces sp. GF20]RZE89758.1 hypothetical protein C0R04_19715 [Streptomyces albidoflavus]RZE91439.1 hypothetical protein C0R03_19730 [Streptomyces albidoflavus]UKL06237.1 hypothetical protein L2I08_26345 [Streptomyces sp. NBU3104]